MAARKFSATWDDLAVLDADHMARWGCFDGFHGPVGFDDVTPSRIMVAHDRERDVMHAAYGWSDDAAEAAHVGATVALERRPCGYGGSRVHFLCPCCARRTLRLAAMGDGLRCGKCGSITWASRRETETQRLVRKANKLASRLGLDHFSDAPIRPPRMRLKTYLDILTGLEPLKAEINHRVRARMARAGAPFSAMAGLARWGL